eukprot:CAMPEP_0178441496 /NCGR_PEP_ID=MMETSP0689_2-20121128/37498_1 /TAXON_ID=160604 /ORGANISM="Amphidinium massartii, Strain CS-259" /LENGTH=30 /DNA_ID= /DNA_START= /DNA_END= /DNA_ORIENTATION=
MTARLSTSLQAGKRRGQSPSRMHAILGTPA